MLQCYTIYNHDMLYLTLPLICFVETRQAIRVADHPREQMPLDRCASPV